MATSIFRAILAIAAGVIVGWFLLAGFCSIPGIAFSTACGHNAYIWLPITIPLGIFITWVFIGRICRAGHKQATSTHKDGCDA